MQQLNKELRELKGRVRSANEERDQLLNERQELFKRRAKLELAVKDLQEEVNGDMDAKVSQIRLYTLSPYPTNWLIFLKLLSW